MFNLLAYETSSYIKNALEYNVFHSLQNRRNFLRIFGEKRRKRGERELRARRALLPSRATRARLPFASIRLKYAKIPPVLQAMFFTAVCVIFLIVKVVCGSTRLSPHGSTAAGIFCRLQVAGCRLQVETTCLFELKSNKPQYKG